MNFKDALKLALQNKQSIQNHRTVAGTKRARQMMSSQSKQGGIVVPNSKREKEFKNG